MQQQQHQQPKQQHQQQQQQQQMMQQQQMRQMQEQQQKLQQMQAMKAKQEQMRLQQEEMKRKQQEEMKRKADEQRQKMEEMNRQRMEMQKKAAEEQKRRQEEQRAIMTIRRVTGKVRLSTEETLATNQQELAEVMAKELPHTGAQMESIKKECEQAVDAAKNVIKQRQEAAAKAAAQKEEFARKQKEIQDKAEALLKELAGKVSEVEDAVTALKEAAEPLLKATEMKQKDIDAKKDAIDEAVEKVAAELKSCQDFVKDNNSHMRVATAKPLQPGSQDDVVPTLPQLIARLGEATKTKDATVKSAAGSTAMLAKKAGAQAKLDSQNVKFAKYDLNKDGVLDEKEMAAYAKKEFALTLQKSALAKLMAGLVTQGAKGVPKAEFHRLQVQIGIAREMKKDAERKKAREAREKEIEEMKEDLKEKVKEVDEKYAEVEEEIKKLESAAEPLRTKGKTMKSTEIGPLCDELDEKVTAVKEAVATFKKEVAELREGVDSDVLHWFTSGPLKPLDGKAGRLEPWVGKTINLLQRCRADAKNKASSELKVFEKQAVDMMKFHKKEKDLSADDLYVAIAKKAASVDKKAFLKFFKTCEKEPAPEDEKKTAAASPPSEEDLGRLFDALAEDGKAISKERMMSLMRSYMKVVKDTVLTDGISIKESKSLRRLEVGEVLEILGNPKEEGEEKVTRVQCRASKDGLEGYVTVSGNQGTAFLQDHSGLFKVVKETILTLTFDLDSEEAKEAAKQLKDANPRKLRPGEMVDVWIWPMKEEKSGLMRLKCKTKNDNVVGWATAVGNAGTVFMQPM
eukprot:TRINITY_DN2261_c0_g1_i5.p1 TRINITY_DN2261_c0_g1~~TRINITY_DN2261_c0_g1_i5.p1  ORF type:complete len:798 (-),score=282.58 TRINITY_DN2261_c0_g1_i5:165-2558(-)